MKNTDTLKKNYEFKNVLTKGKGYFGNCLIIFVMKEKANQNKIGIAVGKKIGKAVTRNQIKRWIRESYRQYEEFFNENYRIVFLLNKNVVIEQINYKRIKEDMEKLFKESGILD